MAELITFEKIEEIMNDYFPATDTMEWHGLEIEVSRTVPFALAAEIVVRAANACFNADGEYLPENSDFAFRLCVIDAYTNIDLPEEIEAQNRLLYGTDLWGAVIRMISEDQLNLIEYGINRRVKARLDTNRAEFERGVNEVITGLQQLSEQFTGMMDGIEPDDLRRMVQAIGENGIDEEKIVQAVVAEQNKMRDNVVAFPGTEAGTDGE